MARPTKQGLDYFPMDCSPDGKLELFIAENGCDGFGLLVMLWQMIYRGDGYYIKYDEDLILRLRRESLLPAEKVVSVVGNAVKRGIFSVNVADNYGVLTSAGIQKRFFSAAKKKKTISVEAEILLIDVSEYENLVFSSGNPVSVAGNATKESKVNKSKVKRSSVSVEERGAGERRVEETTTDTSRPEQKNSAIKDECCRVADDRGKRAAFQPPTKQETLDFFEANGSGKDEAARFWYHYDANGWMAGRVKMKSWTSAAHKWIRTNHYNRAYNGHTKTTADIKGVTRDGFERALAKIADIPGLRPDIG